MNHRYYAASGTIPSFCAVGVFFNYSRNNNGHYEVSGKNKKEIAKEIVINELESYFSSKRHKVLFCDRVNGKMDKDIISHFSSGSRIRANNRDYRIAKLFYRNPNTGRNVVEMHVIRVQHRKKPPSKSAIDNNLIEG